MKYVNYILLSALLFLSILISNPVSSAKSSEMQKVYDNGNIFSREEKTKLEELCRESSRDSKLDIIVLTESRITTTRKEYIENFYDQNDTSLTDSVILLINMDPDDRGVQIAGFGQGEFNISDSRSEKILDCITPLLAEGSYYEAIQKYVQEVIHYMNMPPDTNYKHTEKDNKSYNENYYENNKRQKKINIPILLAISAVVGGIITGIMAYRSGGRMTVNQDTYLANQNSRVLARHDRYIRTTVTKIKRPEPPSNHGSGNSGGGGGVTSGGHSHSGAGRSF